MNELIRKCERESHIDVYGLGLDRVKWEAALEKFAELIVQECARIGELKEQGYEDYDPNLSVGWYMKQHFGVKS
jgi:hypothetical protein